MTRGPLTNQTEDPSFSQSPLPQYMSTKQLAQVLCVHYLTVLKHIKAGNIHYVRIGKLYKISVEEAQRIRKEGLPPT